ncbi:MAG: 50S ribosomal protein L12, partial [Methanococcaceae archaeon]
MEYVYAALLLHSAGKKVTEEGITAVIKAAGLDVDAVRAKALVSALDGVNIEEAIAKAA